MRIRLASQSLATAVLLASTALTAPAFAQSASGGFGNTQPTDVGRVSATGTAAPDGYTGTDIGGGYMIQEDQPKGRSTVTRDAIAKLSPTANPYQMIAALPGANVFSPTAFGLNGGDITVHGFQSSELGLTIDGMPVNDSGNYALYPQEYVDAENLGQVSLAPGYSDLDSPHIGATGGVINIYSRDPSKEMGGYADVAYGSSQAKREFIRLETGQVGLFRGYISFSHYGDNHWRGPGKDYRDNLEAKGVIDVHDASKITLSVLWNKAVNYNYNSPTKSNFNAYGPNADQNNLGLAYNYGGTALNQKTAGSASGNQYYGFRVNPFDNLIVTAPSTFVLTDNLTYDVVPYFWYGFGNGGGATTLNEAGLVQGGNISAQDINGNGTKTDKLNVYTPSITQTYRPGVINKFTYQLGNHQLIAGWLYEDANHRQYSSTSLLNPDGSPQNVWGDGPNLIVYKGAGVAPQGLEKRDIITRTRTNILFVGDHATFLEDTLTVDAGMKYAYVTRHSNNLLPSGPYGTIHQYTNSDTVQFLPSIAANYKLTEHNNLFAGFGTSFRAAPNFTLQDSPSALSTGTPYPSNLITSPANPVKPETAQTLEFGHRFQGDMITTSTTFFGTKFQNRQLSTNLFYNNVLESVTLNVGSTTTYGVDFEAGTRKFYNFRPYISAEYLSSTFDGNTPTTGTLGSSTVNTLLKTQGKMMPNAAKYSGFIGVDYDDDHLFGNLNAHYTGVQNATFMNDEKIAPYTSINAVVGYRFNDYQGLKRPEVRLNLSNLTDQKVLTGASSIQNNRLTQYGTNGARVSGGTPSYYVNQGFAAIITLSSGF